MLHECSTNWTTPPLLFVEGAVFVLFVVFVVIINDTLKKKGKYHFRVSGLLLQPYFCSPGLSREAAVCP